MSRRVDDYFPFGCGDIVRENDGRHEARVEAVVSNEVRVKWLETGWRSAFQASELTLVRRAGHVIAATQVFGRDLVLCAGDAMGPIVARLPRR